MKTNDGGPMFPSHTITCDKTGKLASISVHSEGMSLRDWFAGMALQGFCSQCATDGGWSWKPEEACREAYNIADAMLAERSRTP